MAMKIDLRPGESIEVGDVVIRMVKKSGQLASLVIDAPKSVPIRRADPSGGTTTARQVVVAPA